MYKMNTFSGLGIPIRYFINAQNKVYFCMSDIAQAADNKTLLKWGSKSVDNVDTILIPPKECIPAFKTRGLVAISFAELRKALSNNPFTPYHYSRLSTVVKSLEKFIEQLPDFEEVPVEHFEEMPVKPTPTPVEPITVDDFVKRMHELVIENEELKNKVVALEAKLSEYEALKDMFLSI